MVAFVIQTSYLIVFYFSRQILLQRKVWRYFNTALTTADSETLIQDSKDTEWPLTPGLMFRIQIQKSLPRVEIWLCTVMNVTI